MRRFSALFLSFAVFFAGIPSAFAGVVGSDEVVLAEQQQYSRQQILSLVDSAAVQEKLVSLGVDADDARPPIVEGRGTVDFKNPRAVANLSLQFHGLKFPQPGAYRVQLLSDGELLREARLDLIQFKPGKRPPEEDSLDSA